MFASVTRKDVFPHINVENTLLQIMALNLFTEVNYISYSSSAVDQIVQSLTDSQHLWFLGDQRNHNPLKQIKLHSNPVQIFDIDENVFTASVKKIECTPKMTILYDQIRGNPEENPEPQLESVGVLIALVMLEEVSNDNVNGLKNLLREYCTEKARLHSARRTRGLWNELNAALDEKCESPNPVVWLPDVFWKAELEKTLYDLKSG
jgi:hypothetical protein